MRPAATHVPKSPSGLRATAPKHPAFLRVVLRERQTLTREQVARTIIRGAITTLCACKTHVCEDLDESTVPPRCGWYGDGLKGKDSRVRRCDECVEDGGK